MSSRRLQQRARYARTSEPGGLRVNAPAGAGIPSGQPPVVWYWASDSPLPLQATSGQLLASVSRATSLIVNTITSAPWRLLSGSSDPRMGVIELPPRRWLQDPMLYRPDDRFGLLGGTVAALRQPRAVFWSQWLRSCLWHGMGFLIFEESSGGEPLPGSMKILNPDYVSPVSDPFVHRRIGPDDGSGLSVGTDPDGRFTIGGHAYRLVELTSPLGQVDVLGLTEGALTVHARELGLADAAVTYARGTLRSGVPSGYLKSSAPVFTKVQADALREQWYAHHDGDERSVAVLNATTDFVPISMSPVDLALIEQRKMSLVDVSNAFGVPVYLLGGGDAESLNYTNAESRSLDFRTYTLLPWANAVEDVLSALLPQGQWVNVDFRGLLKADTATRYQSYEVGLRNGFLTLPEVRNLENLPPLEESVTPALTAANQGLAPEPEEEVAL